METRFHFFVNMIDPRFVGSSLTIAQRKKSKEFFDEYLLNIGVKDHENSILRTLRSFKSKTSKFLVKIPQR